MDIAGIQKLTLVDFPGHVAATVFTRGCSFRCGFCHNPELVIPDEFNPLLPEAQIFDFFESRYGKLSGVCITGGEPLFQPDCDRFISHIKALGFAVKLDTNGSYPERLAKVIADGDVDYLAMDIKAPLSKYESVALNQKSELKGQNCNSKIKTQRTLAQNIQKSIKLIMDSGIDYEFRTTVSHPTLDLADFDEMGQMIRGSKRYFIQNYRRSKQIDKKTDYKPFSDTELEAAKKTMAKYVDKVEIR